MRDIRARGKRSPEVAAGARWAGTVTRVDQLGRTVVLDRSPAGDPRPLGAPAEGGPGGPRGPDGASAEAPAAPPGGAHAAGGLVEAAAAPPREVRCQVRGALAEAMKRDGRGRTVAGDRVWVALAADGTGIIEAVEPRRSQLARRSVGDPGREQITAANLDRVAVVVAAREPAWKPGFVDRVLCAAERADLPALIVVNKVDLCAGGERAALERELEPYAAIGVPVLLASARTGEGIEALARELAGRVTALAGPSGVGKSSLLNAVEPGLGLRIGEVSASTAKGRHTTTQVAMVPLAAGGFVVDTPGVRAFGFFDLDAREVGWLFRELRPFAFHDGDHDQPRCRFHDCLHQREPGCEVRRAVDEGRLSTARYESYLRIIDSLARDPRDGDAGG